MIGSGLNSPGVIEPAMRIERIAPVSPDLSVFVADVHAAYDAARRAGVDIVHPLTTEAWGVTRFYPDASGHVVNVGTHD